MSTADFLSGIPGDKKLSEITVPGSHDAGVYVADAKRLAFAPKAMSICQTKDLNGQCHAGSRYFDIRIGSFGGELKAQHIAGKIRVGATGGELGAMMRQLQSFVTSQTGKNEFVIARFSKSSNHKEIVDYIKDNFGKDLFKGDANIAKTKLSDVRGKIIAVFADKFEPFLDPAKGIHRFASLDEKAGRNNGLFVCGKYANSTNMVKVYNDAFRHLNEHDGHTPGDHLNLTYWTQTGGLIQRNSKKEAVPQLKSALQDIRHRNVPAGQESSMEFMLAMEEVLERRIVQNGISAYQAHAPHLNKMKEERRKSGLIPPKLPNVVMYDFINEASSEDIIALNFPTLRVGTV